jgi:hypothetical protein
LFFCLADLEKKDESIQPKVLDGYYDDPSKFPKVEIIPSVSLIANDENIKTTQNM